MISSLKKLDKNMPNKSLRRSRKLKRILLLARFVVFNMMVYLMILRLHSKRKQLEAMMMHYNKIWPNYLMNKSLVLIKMVVNAYQCINHGPSLVIYGFKRFEGRHWTSRYRGPLWIQAGSKVPT